MNGNEESLRDMAFKDLSDARIQDNRAATRTAHIPPFFLSFFSGCTHGVRKFPDRGSNPSKSSALRATEVTQATRVAKLDPYPAEPPGNSQWLSL